jgi:bifunctional non-homologous end joining protein LigD
MLCTLVDKPPEGPEWLHEIKLDGYRLIARLDEGKVALLTRQGHDWAAQFPAIAQAVAALTCESAILDGEAVVLDSSGKSSFQALQGALGTRRPDLFYYAFDLIHVNGEDLTATPLIERKRALRRLLQGAESPIRYSDHMEGAGAALFAKACEAGLEGLVAKKRDSRYTGDRGTAWLKVKCLKRQEMVVVGFTEPKGSRGGLGALLMGVHRDGALVYAGKVGTGFTTKLLGELRAKLDALEVKKPTVDAPAAVRRGAHWVKPVLVAEVSFSEWTRDGVARHPSFQGLRGDKAATDVVREEPAAPPARKSSLRITNPERVLFPDPGITKRELMGYYEAVAERVIPAIAHRPLMIVRYPTGYEGIAFHQKHANKGVPRSVPRVEVGEEEPFIMVEKLDDLLALVQLSSLELHIWGSTADALETPDTLVFDLDPDPTLSWKRVVAIARAIDEKLRAIGLTSFPRVTGGKGLHLVVPIVPEVDWDQAKSFTQTVAEWMARERPTEITANMAKARRTGKVYIDYLRNGRGQTAVASYSTRARAGGPVAMPLDWDQLGETRDTPPVFPLREAPAWIAKNVPWKGYENARRGLKQVLR